MSNPNTNHENRAEPTPVKQASQQHGILTRKPGLSAGMTIWIAFVILSSISVLMLTATSCGRSKEEQKPVGKSPPDSPQFLPVDIAAKKFASSGRFFVPIYSDLAMGDGRHSLGVTLSINNTDLDRPVVVSSVRFYDRTGAMRREFLEKAHSLSPMASVEFLLDGATVIEGGKPSASGFVVEWEAEDPVNEPVVEAVMAQWAGTYAYAFVSHGRRLEKAQEPESE